MLMWRVAPYAAAVAIGAAAIWFAYDSGYEAAQNRYEASMAQEEARRRAANAQAGEFSRELIDELLGSREKRAVIIEELENEASESSNASDTSVDADGVRRIDEIQ